MVGMDTRNSHDPSLTPYGFEQAALTGKLLADVLKKNAIDKVVVETSPMIRCMQTAKQIALQLGVKSIKINFEFMELLEPYCFNGSMDDPRFDLELTSSDFDPVKMKDKYAKDYTMNDDFWDFDKCAFEVPDNFDPKMMPKWPDGDNGVARAVRIGKYMLESA